MRKTRLPRLPFVALLAAGLVSCSARAEQLTVVSWGGSYEAAQRQAYLEPFARAAGVELVVERYDGGLIELRREVASGHSRWDVIDLLEEDARAACDQGLLLPIDGRSVVAPGPDGTPVEEDFLPGTFSECGIAHIVFSSVIAYDERAFPGEKPQTVRDFFDVERFPGKRALRFAPTSVLEWAMMAEGVPNEQVYDLLSTERGLRLAFRRLEGLREHLVWWRAANAPAALLELGRVTMASGYNGRFFYAQAVEGAPLTVLWDGQILDYSVWGIVSGTPDVELAKRFIRFATEAEPLAELAERIAYGPTRRSAYERIGLHPDLSVPMSAYLPTAPHRLEHALRRDTAWYAKTEALRQQWFESWTGGGEMMR